ncbi:hypothetical protein FB567DRAFT_31659 [Paraphoma chrysanthemicola]|uniref:Uncharacterized protein n=1 Tax=Paraphoma chrysanthemicola TaxID=798071 RepID=A0A8K0W4M9_9PLEO|nr:hypothetical protein FB567DRAFT_31659 [Paraphoma chrysanthemicola]
MRGGDTAVDCRHGLAAERESRWKWWWIWIRTGRHSRDHRPKAQRRMMDGGRCRVGTKPRWSSAGQPTGTTMHASTSATYLLFERDAFIIHRAAIHSRGCISKQRAIPTPLTPADAATAPLRLLHRAALRLRLACSPMLPYRRPVAVPHDDRTLDLSAPCKRDDGTSSHRGVGRAGCLSQCKHSQRSVHVE